MTIAAEIRQLVLDAMDSIEEADALLDPDGSIEWTDTPLAESYALLERFLESRG